jgi:exportin-1
VLNEFSLSFKTTQTPGNVSPLFLKAPRTSTPRFASSVPVRVALINQYIALQILEKLIQTRWKALPHDQQSGIRNFIVQVTVEVSSDETRMRREKGYLNKLNLVLVQVSSRCNCA